MKEDIFPDIVLVLFFAPEIGTVVVFDSSVHKPDLKIFKKQAFQINSLYMKQPFSTFQNRRREDFSDRNIDISRTVFKVGFRGGISGFEQLHFKICPVSVSAPDLHAACRAENVSHPALDLLIESVIKGIDPRYGIKDLPVVLISFRNRGKRKINDCKTSVFGHNRVAVKLGSLNVIICAELLLYFVISGSIRIMIGTKGSTSECFKNRRSRIEYGTVPELPISIGQPFESPFPKSLIKKQRQIFPVIIVILGIRICSAVSHIPPAERMEKCRSFSGKDHFQAVTVKSLYAGLQDSLKAQMKDHRHSFLRSQVLASVYKTSPVTLRYGFGDQGDLLLRKFLNVLRAPDLIVGDIFTGKIQLPQICSAGGREVIDSGASFHKLVFKINGHLILSVIRKVLPYYTSDLFP